MFPNSSEHPGQPQRPPASAHFVVSSTDRYNTFDERWETPTTSASWRTNKQYNLLYGYFTRLALTQLQMQWNLPTIATDRNDRIEITIQQDGLEIFNGVAQIPQGSYTGTQLAAAIQTAVLASTNRLPPPLVNTFPVGAGFTCTYNTGDGDFTFAVSGVDFSFSLTNTSTNNDNLRDMISRTLYTIGMINPAFSPIDEVSFSGDVAPLYYTRWLDICSDTLTQFQRVKDATTLPRALNNNVIARVYPVAPNTRINDEYSAFRGPAVFTIDYNTPKHIRWSPDHAINNFDIQVFDEFGQLMAWDYNNDTEYQMTFLASET